MGKIKGFTLNRKQYDRIRKMDHYQMTLWAESVYKSGYADGKKAASGLPVTEIKQELLKMKGIGEKKACDIIVALMKAEIDKKKALASE